MTAQTKITLDDLEQFEDLPTDKPFDEWSDGALASLCLSSWRAINVTEVYGTRDLKHEQATAKRLVERGYEVDLREPPVGGVIRKPADRDLTDTPTASS